MEKSLIFNYLSTNTVFIVSMLMASPLSATTYYLDAINGDDDFNSGLSSADAWQTIEKINNTSLNPGDTVLLARGHTWRETLTIFRSGTDENNRIIIGAYPSTPSNQANPFADNPIISGAQDITNLLWEGVVGNGGFEDLELSDNDCERPGTTSPSTNVYNGIPGWRIGSSTAHDCSIDQINGNHYLNITNLGGSTAATSNEFHMQADITYQISGRVKPENGNVAKVYLHQVDKSVYLDSSGEWVYPTPSSIQPFLTVNENSSEISSDGWASFTIPFTGIDSGKMIVRVTALNANTNLLIDDIKVVDTMTNYWTFMTLDNSNTKILIEDGVRLEKGALWDPGLRWHSVGSQYKAIRYVPPVGSQSPTQHTVEVARRRTGILIKEKNFITIENITLSGTKSSGGDSLNEGAGILLSSGSSNILVKNVYAINNDTGIRVEGVGSGGELNANNVFTNFEVAHSVSQGIALRNNTQNNVIRNCIVHDLGGFASDSYGQDQESISLGGGTGNINSSIVEFCEVYNAILGSTTDSGVGIVTFKAPNTIIRYNYVHDIGRNGIVVGASSDNSEVYYNVVDKTGVNPNAKKGAGIEVTAAGFPIDGVKVYNNTIKNCVNNDRIYGGAMLRASFSCLGSGCNGEAPVKHAVTNITFKNNIIHGCTGMFPMSFVATDIDFDTLYSDNNIFFRNPDSGNAIILFQGDNYDQSTGPKYTSWATVTDYQTDPLNVARSLDSNSLGTDPLFVDAPGNNFRLKARSPAVDIGTVILNTQDIDGNVILGSPDAGAFEFGHNDTDSDGLIDYDEVCFDGDCQKYNPYNAVTNHSGTDLDIDQADTDGDGYLDSTEVTLATNPLDASSTPVIIADGDVNLDQKTDVADILISQRSVLGLTTLTAEQIAHGDYLPAPDGDGQLTLPDLLLIYQAVFSTP